MSPRLSVVDRHRLRLNTPSDLSWCQPGYIVIPSRGGSTDALVPTIAVHGAVDDWQSNASGTVFVRSPISGV